MNLVGFLLTSEFGRGDIYERKRWLLDPQCQETGCNYTYLEKEGENVVLGCLFDEDPYERALTVPVPIMIDLLTQWDAVCKTDPDEVTVYYENGKFRVEGHKKDEK
jgi:hypothetical protein